MRHLNAPGFLKNGLKKDIMIFTLQSRAMRAWMGKLGRVLGNGPGVALFLSVFEVY